MSTKLFLALGIVSLLSFTALSDTPKATQVVATEQIQPAPVTPVYTLTKEDRKEVRCLADNIYFEAGSEPTSGKTAVGLVTMNRVSTSGFPSTVCDVVRQSTSSGCQFSWWCDRFKRSKAVQRRYSEMEQELYDEIYQVALRIYQNYDTMHDVTKGAVFFHSRNISPGWRGVKRTTQIGQHVFYRKI